MREGREGMVMVVRDVGEWRGEGGSRGGERGEGGVGV